MIVQQYNIQIIYKGETLEIPVLVTTYNNETRVSANVNGVNVIYMEDEHHNGLRPDYLQRNMDMELLYQIGNEICKQRFQQL